MSATGRSAAADTGHVRHPDDYYSTPAWCTRAILRHLTRGPVLDPFAGTGAILAVVKEAWGVDRYGIEIDEGRAKAANVGHADALTQPWPPMTVITNPPYALAMECVLRAMDQCPSNDRAFLLRLNWLGSQRRAAFHKAHPSDIFVLPRRPSFTGGGTDATEYAWFVWGPGRGNRWFILDIDN